MIQLINSECINDRLIFSLESEDEIINSHALSLFEILYGRTNLELKDFSEIIVKLIHNVNNITTYALSRLLNCVFNKKDSNLVSTINFECLMEQFNKLNLNYLYSWSEFISRFHINLDKKGRKRLLEIIKESNIDSKLTKLSFSNLNFESLVRYIEVISYIDLKYSSEIFQNNFHMFREAFKNNSLEAFHALSFGFESNLMGFNPLNDKRQYLNSTNKLISTKIVSLVLPKQFAQEIISCSYRQ